MDNPTATTLVVIASLLLSLIFEYLPGASTAFGKLVPEQKKLVMAGLLLLTTVSVFTLSCYSPWTFVSCDQPGAWALVEAFALAIAANQGGHRLFKKLTPQQ